MAYCTNCGSPLEPGLQFCTHCGTSVQAKMQPTAGLPAEPADPVIAKPYAATEWQSMLVVSSQQHVASQKGGCLPTVLIVLVVLALAAAVGIGGLVYAGYKMKQKAAALLHNSISGVSSPVAQPASSPSENKPGSPAANPPGDATGILDGLSKILGGDKDEGDPVESINDKTPVEPCPAASLPSQSAAKIPLQPETVITYSWGMKNGDVESRNSVSATTPTSFVEEKKQKLTRMTTDIHGQLPATQIPCAMQTLRPPTPM